jgi:hypothetical protein
MFVTMFLSFHAMFSGMITYMLMIVNTAVQKTRNSHVEKLLSTKKTQATSEIKNRFYNFMEACRAKRINYWN